MQTETKKPIDIITKDAADSNTLKRASEMMMVFEGSSDGEWFVWFVRAKDITTAKQRLYSDYDTYFESFAQFQTAMFNRDTPKIRYIGRGYLRFADDFPFKRSQSIVKLSEYVTRIGGIHHA